MDSVMISKNYKKISPIILKSLYVPSLMSSVAGLLMMNYGSIYFYLFILIYKPKGIIKKYLSSKKKSEIKHAPIEEWINTFREHIDSQRFTFNFSLMLRWIAMFEEHPDPATCYGIDYKAIYFYIADLMDVDKNLNIKFIKKYL